MIDPATFFESVIEYDKSASNEESKGYNRLGTVDGLYAGAGPARVMFDGETTVSSKAYGFLGVPPRPSTRVVLIPVASTYVIVGMLNGGV